MCAYTDACAREFTVAHVCVCVCKTSFEHLGAVQVNRPEEEAA